VLADVPDVVPVDLGDVDEPDAAVLELEERPIGRDALNGPFDDRAYLEIRDDDSFLSWA